ncbi:638_t:CDS:2, partial [Funneliformis geosporum]
EDCLRLIYKDVVFMDDLRLTPEGDIDRKMLMENNTDIGKWAAFEYIRMKHVLDKSDLSNVDKDFKNMMEEVLRDTEKHQGLDVVMKSRVNILTSSIISTCHLSSLVHDDLLILAGETLPSFRPYDHSARSGWFI